MSISAVTTVGVVGAGTMGQGIAQACAMNGFNVLLYDINDQLTSNALDAIQSNLATLAQKNRITHSMRDEVLKRINITNDLSEVTADLIIEAVVENLDVKKNIFSKLEEINQSHTILASNTSSLSIEEIASSVADKTRFAGLHFFNPATVMKLVEVVHTEQTSSDTVAALREFCLALQKTSVVVKDSPGFIVNRVARLYYVEALRLLEEGAASIEDIDGLLRDAGFKMGPFELMDLIGIDTNLAVTKSIYNAFNNDPKFKPSSIQQNKVDEKKLGRKTGRGFYEYEA